MFRIMLIDAATGSWQCGCDTLALHRSDGLDHRVRHAALVGSITDYPMPIFTSTKSPVVLDRLVNSDDGAILLVR